MAKKQPTNKNTPKPKKARGGFQNISEINTNTFIKGMIKDTDASYFAKDNWFHARNAINNSVDGDVGVIGNEPANLKCAEIPYVIIGNIHLYGDTWAIFCTNNIHSEIGFFDDSKCEYTLIVNDPCLNFKKEYLITGVAKENFDCTWQVYWDDALNPSRTLNVNDVPYVQIENTPVGSSCITYENAQPLKLNCEKIRLAPLVNVPCIELSKADEGGLLENGSYQIYTAYTINDKPVTDYIGISNIQPIWSHEDTQGSLTVTLSNLDKRFDWITVAIKRRIKGQPIIDIIGVYSTETTEINIDYINKENPKLLSSNLQRRNPAYEKSDGMYVVNDYLIRTQPTEQFDFNYQPIANRINTYWTSTIFPSNYYKNGGNKPTLLRDEQYAFFIVFIYNTGEKSSSYHIPGRAPNPGELDPIGANNAINPTDRQFEGTNTASSTPGDPFVSTLMGNETEDGGIVVDGGQMGYWESTEVYSPTDPLRWDNLCGQPIRHHKIPDESVGSAGTFLTNSGDTINVIGVAFDNIGAPLDNNGQVIPNIVGYEIMVGGRAGHRSIIAKGIIKNMFLFQKDQNDKTANNGAGSGLMPNYPYNDLRNDPYLINRNSGNDSMPWYTQITSAGSYPGGTIESNWLRGNNNGPADGNALSNISTDTYTYHSPDLNFSHMYLNPTEIRIYKTISGPVTGQFKKSEDHPRAKLLKNRAATVAALIGVGYALKEMRGKRNYKIDTMRSFSEGQSGVIPGVQGAPVAGTGTGLAALNIAATAPSILTGTLADVGFNLVVDTASIFGAGNLARTVGTPFYQLVETGSAGLAAGHIGPQRSIEYEGSDFSSVPSIMSIAVGVISFLNYTAVGGDKIIDLILNLMSFQDYVMKYISHGYYSQENQFIGNGFSPPKWRIGVERARYIKSALQSFDGNMVVQNNLRPSTVVVRTSEPWTTSWPAFGLDNTKFTIGEGPCAGDRETSLSWWNPGDLVKSTCYANYASFKTPIRSQYGQLEQIIQLHTQGCFNFKDQQLLNPNGTLIPITPYTTFSTNTIYAGDSYIARYTEKTIMPFFYLFLKEGNDGIPFDYSKYANVPFPRYWMNSEKFEMSEFVKPIMSISFNWSTNSEALPSAYYNLDTPANGGYCGTTSLAGSFGFGAFDNTSLQNGTTGSSGNTNTTTGNNVSIQNNSTIFTDPQDPFNLANGGANAGINNRYQIVTITGSNITYNLNILTNNSAWSLTGACNQTSIVPPGVISSVVSTQAPTPFVTIDVSGFLQGYNLPLWLNNDGSGLGNISCTVCGSSTTGWTDFLKQTTSPGSAPNSFSGSGIVTLNAVWDWSNNTFVGVTNAATGNSGTLPLLSTGSIAFSNSTSTRFVTSAPDFNCTLDAGQFTIVSGTNVTTNPSSIVSSGLGASASSSTNPSTAAANDDLQGQLDDAFGNSTFGDPSQSQTVGGENPGGLFVVKNGYMYSHNCGVNDFWVESDMNLGYRDWEDVPRKRHYDNDTYSDLVELFHANQVTFDNYYLYDRSTSVHKFWGTTWAQIQKKYYDPLIAENCFIKYPKRLLYSAPATGWIDKSNMASKNDVKQDFWRVFLTENFRDFKSKVTTIKPINQTGAMIFFPTLSPKSFQGQDRLQLSNTKITIGDGGLFSQAFQNVTNSDVSHEYGSCESARSVLSTPYGLFFVSQAQGKIFMSGSKGIQAISDMGMKWWFNKFLPSKLLEAFPEIEDCPQIIDNPVVGAGVQTVYDPNNSIVYFTKKDYMPLDSIGKNCIVYHPCKGFYYDTTNCGSKMRAQRTCPEGYSLIIDENGIEKCELIYQAPPIISQSLDTEYGVSTANPYTESSRILNLNNTTSSRYGRDMPIVINNFNSDGLPASLSTPSDWTNLTKSWWRNQEGNENGGLMNQLARGYEPIEIDTNTFISGDIFSYIEVSINLDATRDVYLLLGADRDIKIIEKYPEGEDLEIIAKIDPISWSAQISADTGVFYNDPGFNWIQNQGDNLNQSIASSKLFLYKHTLKEDASRLVISGKGDNNHYTKRAMIAFAIIDVDNLEALKNAEQWSDLPKLYSTEDGPLVNSLSTGVNYFSCNEEYMQFTDSTEGSSKLYPVCKKEVINNNCECVIDSTSNIRGTLFGTCPVNEGSGSSYCEYRGYAEYITLPVLVPIDVTDTNYFKDVSWTVSYDPKSKAWISFHDWHPDLTFNSINHFLTSKSQTTNTPQCPPGYTWDFQYDECCLVLNHDQPADVFVDEFMADVDVVPATVTSFTETIDVAIVIDNSGSTGPSLQNTMVAQLNFATEFINGMAPGMTGGAYAGQVRIGHGFWNDSVNGSGTAPVVVTPLTANPATATASLTVANYPSGGGTCFKEAVDLGNLIMANSGTPSTATNKLIIFVTDGQSQTCSTALGNFTNATECISVWVNNDNTQINCSYTGTTSDPTWVQLIAPMISGTGLSSPANAPVCNSNLYHLGDQIPDGEPGAFDTVAKEIIDSFFSCTCPAGTILDIAPTNDPCAPLPAIGPDCIKCSCPTGYTLIGDCNDSSSLPICRKMDCECYVPYFNTNETVTQTGVCDDIILWYNPNTGYGNDSYVNNDPLMCHYSYNECIPPNYETGSFWKHNVRTDLFNNYYGINYPWEIDIIETTGQLVTTIRSIEYQMEAFLYQNDGKDRFHDLDYNFDEAVIYNTEQVSGLLNLILEPKNNIQLSILYPIVNPSSMDILYSKEEQKYRFNMFWDITEDRGEFSNATNTIWLTDWDGYVRDLNPNNLNYQKPQQQRKKFRHYFNHILLRKSDQMSTTRKMLLKLENTKLNMSSR